jgi:acetyl esterase/lipase
MFPGGFAQWFLEYATQHSAIIVAADYRLMPESNGLEILSDVSDFWIWMQNDLQTHLGKAHAGVEADLSKVIAFGESSGGALAIQSGLTQQGLVKAVIAAYPAIDLRQKLSKPLFGAPTVPTSVLQDHLKCMAPGAIVSSALPPARVPLILSMVQQGTLASTFGDDEKLLPLKVLEKVEDMSFMLLIHGRDDITVPVASSVAFEETARNKFGERKVKLVIESGDHGFDVSTTLGTPWLKEGLDKVTELWLAN